MRKRIQQFMETDELIKACYKDDSRQGLSTFGVTVCGCAPQLRAGGLSVDVIWDSRPANATSIIENNVQDTQLTAQSPEPVAAISRSSPQPSAGPVSSNRELGQDLFGTKTQFEATVCGKPIQFRANGKQSNATLGAIVKLIYKNGSFDLKGLTIAHAAIACLDDDSLGDSALSLSSFEDEDEDEDDDKDSSMDGDWDSNNRDSECAHMLDLGNESSTQRSRKQHDPWVFGSPHTIGKACLAQSMLSALKGEPAKGGRFFDWALTPLSDLMMNQLPSTTQRQGSHLIWRVRQFSLDATWFASEPGLVICGSSGVKRGRLVPEPSRIIISPDSVFVTAYMIELSKDGVLSNGDSGSWVISENTQDLLGHIVATDALGTGYFIPADDIFNDIIQNSLALAVTLPTVK